MAISLTSFEPAGPKYAKKRMNLKSATMNRHDSDGMSARSLRKTKDCDLYFHLLQMRIFDRNMMTFELASNDLAVTYLLWCVVAVRCCAIVSVVR